MGAGRLVRVPECRSRRKRARARARKSRPPRAFPPARSKATSRVGWGPAECTAPSALLRFAQAVVLRGLRPLRVTSAGRGGACRPAGLIGRSSWRGQRARARRAQLGAQAGPTFSATVQGPSGTGTVRARARLRARARRSPFRDTPELHRRRRRQCRHTEPKRRAATVRPRTTARLPRSSRAARARQWRDDGARVGRCK